MTNDLTFRPACDLGREIEAGTLDPRDVAEAFLEAIATHPDSDRIYTCTTPQRARAEAEAAHRRARSGTRRGPLDGVPISWKDLIDSAGTRTEAGTALMKDRIPAHDADVLRAATLGGSVCLGKTHLTELAFAGLGYNCLLYTSPSPRD